MRFNEAELEALGYVRDGAGNWYKPRRDAAVALPDRLARVCAPNPQPAQRNALERAGEGKEASGVRPARRARIRFVVHAVRPADCDGHHFKEIIDMLVKAEILDGDAWDVLECDGIRSEKVHSKIQERTEIFITL